MTGLPGTPKKGRGFGGDAAHQKAMFGTLRPVVEKCVTKAKNAAADPSLAVHNQRHVVALIRDKDMAHKLFAEIGPRYADRPGGYTRILKLGPRHGDNAPMARIEFV
jgi:large subunit ribosomal protein L17